MKLPLPYLDKQNGFTLVELIITATFVAAASAAIVGIFITIEHLNRESRNLTIATQIAQQKLETYRNANYNSIAVTPPADDFSGMLPANFGTPKSALVTVTETTPGLKKVDIAISYTENKVPKKVQISTYIAQRGIDR